MADAFWLQGFGVALLTLCLFVGGKQKKETKITISTRKKSEHSMPPSSRVHRTEAHTVLRVQLDTFAILAQVPLFPAPMSLSGSPKRLSWPSMEARLFWRRPQAPSL